ncbi:hypothetical protein [Mucilaginibacter sp.]|uniref:hypothetical protein n=1 Tax=Mucilaginibacter sp. TaxID=1882438 RepID=UPI0025ED450C|nr:hypothetical protein [Mucilaginibacter sp.]
MSKITLLKKSTDTTDYVSDITKAFTALSKKNRLYHITLDGIPTKKVENLNFQLTNKFFNKINKVHRNPYDHLNYLFVLEYGGIISKNKVYSSKINNLGIHAHCLVDTSLSKAQLEFYINTVFERIPDYKIQNISNSTTKDGLLNYLLKQHKTRVMTEESYNYKIWI